MARSPYTGVNDVSAPVDQPSDQLRIDASPDSFGAPLAQGAEALGSGAIDASKFYNQVAADHATNNYLDARTKILYGDPSKPSTDATGQPVMGPDGKPVPDTGFFGRRGMDAMSARESAQSALDEAAQEQQSSLSTPQSREAFENQSRRFRASDMASMAQHADQQQKVWATDTNNNAATLAGNDVARVASDDTASTAAGDRLIAARVKNAQLAGESPDGAILKAKQEIIQTRIRALSTPQAGAAGAAKAEDIFEKNGDILASLPGYDQLGRQVKEQYVNTQVGPAIDTAVNDAVAQAQAQAATGAAGSTYVDKVGGRETGGAANAATAKNPRSSASGVDQFTDGTWLDVMKGPQFAEQTAGKSREQILALKTDPALQAQATMAYAQQNTPILTAANEPANAMTLGLAHGFGPQGAINLLKAAPDTPASQVLSPQAMAANPQLANQTAGEIVQGFNKRFGAGAIDASGSPQYPSATDALNASIADRTGQFHQQMAAKFPQFPDVVDRATDQFTRRLEQQVTQQKRGYEVDTHTIQQVMATDNPPISEEQLKSVSPQVAQAWANVQINNPYAAISFQHMLDANARGRAGDYGAAFHDYLDRATAPETDQNHIANSSQLWPFVGVGDDAPLTNTGVTALSNVVALRATPQGQAQLAQIRAFADQVHGDLTFSNKGTGIVDQKGEKIYAKFMAGALPVMMNAAKNGNLASVLDPKSKDYLGTVATTFARPPAQILKDRAEFDAPATGEGANPLGIQHPLLHGPVFTPQTLKSELDSLENNRQRAEAITDFKRAGRLPADVYRQYWASLHGAAPTVGTFAPPTPHVNPTGQ